MTCVTSWQESGLCAARGNGDAEQNLGRGLQGSRCAFQLLQFARHGTLHSHRDDGQWNDKLERLRRSHQPHSLQNRHSGVHYDRHVDRCTSATGLFHCQSAFITTLSVLRAANASGEIIPIATACKHLCFIYLYVVHLMLTRSESESVAHDSKAARRKVRV